MKYKLDKQLLYNTTHGYNPAVPINLFHHFQSLFKANLFDSLLIQMTRHNIATSLNLSIEHHSLKGEPQ